MTETTAFETRFGFKRSDVTLANWRLSPFNQWSFQNLRELVPSMGIASAAAPETLPSLGSLVDRSFDLNGMEIGMERFLQAAETDMLLVLKDGKPVAGWQAPHADANRPHIVFSISKSITALVAGILNDQGVLDLEAPLLSLLPEAEGSAYGKATLRQLLDMRLSLDFEEAYTDPSGGFARYRRATLWNPQGGEEPETLRGFLMSIKQGEGEHGGAFRYRSPNSDLLGIVVERATGRRFAELAAERLWQPMGATGEAYVTVDAEGSPRTAGGVLMTAHDLARVGELMRQSGAVGGRQVVSEAFVRDTLENGDKEAWKDGDFAELFAEGSYRNKWYASGERSGAFAAIGIHGQWLYVDPSRGVTIVKMSSQADPTNDRVDQLNLFFFRELAAMV
ncbi:MAG: serine hydrolase [Methylobacterium mesophilicum]|nr:serine hydrolase [Methylobacterium mesophilicum]